MPKAREIAIGITICACRLRSNTIGNKPKKVVAEVSMIARKRCVPACSAANFLSRPQSLARLTKSTIIKLSLTTTPDKATRPKTERIEKDKPSNR